MKINIKRIIKEEIKKVLKEDNFERTQVDYHEFDNLVSELVYFDGNYGTEQFYDLIGEAIKKVTPEFYKDFMRISAKYVDEFASFEDTDDSI